MQRVKKFIPLGIVLMPFMALAQADSSNLNDLIDNLQDLLGNIVPFLIILASVIFIWGVVSFVTAAGNEEKRKVGRDRILWGLIGLFIIVAFWGIVTFIANSLGLPDEDPNFVPIPNIDDPF